MYLRFFLIIIFFKNNGETDATGFNRHKTLKKKKKKNHRKQMWPIVQCIVKVNEQIQTLLR